MADKNLRVVVIGAGMAGILAAIKLEEAGFTDICLYEKADRIGGTWRENTYPGLTCDVPSHHYTYSFERNPNWTRHLPPGDEIQAYFERVTTDYGVDRLIRFGQELTRAKFIEGRWQLSFDSGLSDSADILIAATGVLHHPTSPDIPGMDQFGGEIFHSARWDHSIDLTDKRIGIIGSGSTGVQIISALAGKVAALEHYVRTPQWIMPVENGYYSEEQRAAFQDPDVLREAMNIEHYNAGVNAYTEAITDQESEAYQLFMQACMNNLETSVSDPALRERLRPDHAVMCKRLIFSPDYYQAIQKPGTSLVSEGIQAIEAQGIRTEDGALHELDLIVLATGFDAGAFMRPMQIVGRDGFDLETLWADHAKAYLAISMPEFPNLFMLNGPNGPVGNFSLIDIAEHQWSYIQQLLDKLRSGEADEICATREAMDDFEKDRSEAARNTVWYRGGCNSWYLDDRGIPASWPWTYEHFVQKMASPDLEHFDLRTA